MSITTYVTLHFLIHLCDGYVFKYARLMWDVTIHIYVI
jgi:hypothetical protein